MDYAKYLKYKKKYLMLKNSIGGGKKKNEQPVIPITFNNVINKITLDTRGHDKDNIVSAIEGDLYYEIFLFNYKKFQHFFGKDKDPESLTPNDFFTLIGSQEKGGAFAILTPPPLKHIIKDFIQSKEYTLKIIRHNNQSYVLIERKEKADFLNRYKEDTYFYLILFRGRENFTYKNKIFFIHNEKEFNQFRNKLIELLDQQLKDGNPNYYKALDNLNKKEREAIEIIDEEKNKKQEEEERNKRREEDERIKNMTSSNSDPMKQEIEEKDY